MDLIPEDAEPQPTIEEIRAEQKRRWQETEETITKWEDLIWADAMQIIHGKEMGLAKFKWLRGYGPDPYK